MSTNLLQTYGVMCEPVCYRMLAFLINSQYFQYIVDIYNPEVQESIWKAECGSETKADNAWSRLKGCW
jgi:hypothetical protein